MIFCNISKQSWYEKSVQCIKNCHVRIFNFLPVLLGSFIHGSIPNNQLAQCNEQSVTNHSLYELHTVCVRGISHNCCFSNKRTDIGQSHWPKRMHRVSDVLDINMLILLNQAAILIWNIWLIKGLS